MQLRSISVCNFRKFIDPVMVNGLAPGVNIIAGDNEDGKSTLVQALKAAFYTKHSTSATQAFQPYNSSALPEVSVEFDLEGVNYRLHKSFGKKGVAELRSVQGVFNGSQVEEQLQELLSLGSEKTRDNTSIWNVLWVEQGTAFLSPQLGDVGKLTLSSALENELGRIVSGDDGQQLLRRVSDLYLQWYTPKSGQHAAGSEFKKAEKELAELTEQHARLQEAFDRYKSSLEEAEAVRQKLQQHESSDSVGVARKQWQAACSEEERFGKQFAELEKLQALEKSEQAQYQAVSESWRSRSALVKAVEEYERTLADIAGKLQQLNVQLDETAKNLHACQQQEEQLEQDNAGAEAQCSALEAAAQQRQVQQRIEQMQQSLVKAQEAQKNYTARQKAAESIKVDRKALENLRTIEKQLLQADAQLQAVGTKLEFDPASGQAVTADGAEVDTEQPLLLAERTTFELSGWGSLTVTPGGEGIDKVRDQCQRVRQEMDQSLAALSVASVSEADERETQRASLAQQANDCLREVAHYAPAGTQHLERELGTARAELERLQSAAGSTPAPAVEDPAAALASARALRDRTRQQLAVVRKRTQEVAAKFANINGSVQQLTGQEKNATANLSTANQKLAVAREQESDQELDQRLLEARGKKEQAEAARQALNFQLQGRDAAATKRAVQEAADRLQKVQQEIQTLREQQKELSGSLRTFGKAGIAEEFVRATEKKQQQEEITARLLKKAQAIKLLYETLTTAEQQSKGELMQPILTHLDPYICEVFDGGQLMFDGGNFAVKGLRRGEYNEHYDSLSLGTREQLSVLMRLAFAHVLAANDCPALVILDDALVYSDQRRFEKMQEALLRAAQSFQILILTCRLRDWENLDAPIFKLNDSAQDCDLSASTIVPAAAGVAARRIMSSS